MGKTQDVDLHAEVPISTLKVSEDARELWKKQYEKTLTVTAETPVGTVTTEVSDPEVIKAVLGGKHQNVSMGSTPDLFKSVSPEDFEKLPRPSVESLQAALDEGRRHVDQVKGIAHMPSVHLVHPEQAKDLAVEMVESQATEITFADFEKIDIRVGQIKSAERVPKSDKLLKLEVDFGLLGTRTILAGIGKAEAYPSPAILVGNRYAFVVNLAPRKMMGILSHGMALAAGTGPSNLCLLKCGGENVPPGTRVG